MYEWQNGVMCEWQNGVMCEWQNGVLAEVNVLLLGKYCVCMCLCVYVYMHVYVCMYVCMYVSMCVYVCRNMRRWSNINVRETINLSFSKARCKSDRHNYVL
jgi:hypothetical protein